MRVVGGNRQRRYRTPRPVYSTYSTRLRHRIQCTYACAHARHHIWDSTVATVISNLSYALDVTVATAKMSLRLSICTAPNSKHIPTPPLPSPRFPICSHLSSTTTLMIWRRHGAPHPLQATLTLVLYKTRTPPSHRRCDHVAGVAPALGRLALKISESRCRRSTTHRTASHRKRFEPHKLHTYVFQSEGFKAS